MKSILNQNQKAVLEKAGADIFINTNFYLTGGTVLAEFYLNHRYSEDLDFFSEKEIDVLSLNIFFNKLKKELDLSQIDYQQSFNRNLFFLHFEKEVIKTEFTYFPFPRIEKGGREYGIEIESITDIAVNKLFSIYQRTYARDYIDLYFISMKKEFLISDLIKKAKIKFDWHIDPLQLGTQFIKAKGVEDLPNMIKEIDHTEWQNFFIEEAKKLKDEIIY